VFIGKDYLLYEPGYITLCVGNLTEGKSLYATISDQHINIESILKIESNNFPIMM
jgi:hypothetical protein